MLTEDTAAFASRFSRNFVGRHISDDSGSVVVTSDWVESTPLADVFARDNSWEGCPLMLLGGRTISLVRAIAVCIRHRVPFMLMDRETSSSSRESISNGVGIKGCYDTDRDRLVPTANRVNAAPYPGMMYLVLSSGTSSVPKCSVVSYAAFDKLTTKINDYLFRAGCTIEILHVVNNIQFGYFMWDLLLMAFCSRAARFHGDRGSIIEFGEPTLGSALSLTPTMLCQFLARQPTPVMPHYLFLSGERLSRLHVKELNRHNLLSSHTLISSYALTETGGQVSMLRLTNSSMVEGAAGHPLIGNSIKLDEDGTGAKRLLIKSDTAATGYIQNRLLLPIQADAFIRTDDYAELDDSGALRILGRVRAKPKRNGVIVDLNDLRTTLLETLSCDEVIVELVSGQGADIIVASVFVPTPTAVSLDSMRSFLRESMSTTPDLLIISSELECCANGKLLSPFKTMQAPIEMELEGDAIVERLLFILTWMGIPGSSEIENIGLFDLGLTSLQLVVFGDAASVLFDVPIELAELFRCRHIVDLADRVALARRLAVGGGRRA